MPVHPEVRQIRVLCVDDLPHIRAVIKLVVDGEDDLKCIGCRESADNLVQDVRDLNAEVVLLDATMVGVDPFQAMSELSRAIPKVKTIIYSGYDDQDFIDRALESGAWGYVSKYDAPEEIVRAVRAVAAGNTFLPTTSKGR